MRGVMVAVALVLAATGAQADTQKVKRLKACGVQATNQFGTHVEHPATDEGGGFVGFLTVDEDATGTKQRFSLVNCATRGIVQVKAEYKLADAAKTLQAGRDLASVVAGLRKQGRLANEAGFAKLAKRAGFSVATSTLPKSQAGKTARSDCGCLLYYPDLFTGG